ncbi:hypothetical protein DXG01_000481 [Tephrocybe rancida]|nr:hypothetical protein DXG01_000481 [Tephrocybe rancida]
MIPADNNPTAQPVDAPDGKKPSLGKRILDRDLDATSTESSSAPNNPATWSMELTAPDGKKPSAVKRLLGRLGVSKSTKSGIVSSTAATQSMENVAAIPAPASAVQPAASVLGKPAHHFFTVTHRRPPGVVTAPAVSGAAASVQVVTDMDNTSTTTVEQGDSMPPAVAGPTSAMNVDERGSVTPTATGPTSATNIDQRGSVAAVDQNKFKEGVNVALDGFLTALKVVKDSSDWNPIFKAALGGIMAVVDLAKTVSGNWQDMKDTLEHIQGLLPILETSAKRLMGRKDSFGKRNNLVAFVVSVQTGLGKIQEMQSHGLFRRVLQGTKDANTLRDVYKNIGKALEQFKEWWQPLTLN